MKKTRLLPFSGRTPSSKCRRPHTPRPHPRKPKTQGHGLSLAKIFVVVPKLLKGSDPLFFSIGFVNSSISRGPKGPGSAFQAGVGSVMCENVPSRRPTCLMESSSKSPKPAPGPAPTEPQVGRPEPARSRTTANGPASRRPHPEAAPPGQEGRCPRHYLSSPRWTRRARCPRRGREVQASRERLGERGSNPTLQLLGLTRPSASLLLSPSPNSDRPPPRSCYGKR